MANSMPINGFCCLFKSLIQYFYISTRGPSSVCHRWNTPHFSQRTRSIFERVQFCFPATDITSAGSYVHGGVKSFTSFCLPTDLLWKHLNSSPAFCMTSKQKFSEILKVYNWTNCKGVIIIREGWTCHHFNSRSSYWTPSFSLGSMMKYVHL